MRPRSRWIAALTLVPAFLAACSETPPTGVELTTAGPLLQISDAANTGGRTGFYFLPPMVPDPGPFTGTFDTNLSPEVRVCQLAGSACGTTIKTFTTTTTEPVEVSVPRQTYGVNWSTKNNPSSIATNNKYRIEIRVGTQLLGFADLAFVKTSKDLASLPAGTVGGVLGSPLNVKFRIETRTVGSVTVTPTTAAIALTESQAFSAEVRDLHGIVVPNVSATWTSTNTAAATVSPVSGTGTTATGVAAGTTVIAATAGGVAGSAELTVMRKPNAEDDSYSGTAGQLLSPGATPALPTLLANDDVGSPSGTITSVSVDGTAHPLPLPQGGIPFAGGLLQVWPDGNFSVSTQQAGQFSFRYTLTNAGSSDDASVTVTMGSSSPAAMVALSDQDQTATAGTAVAEPPSVRVTDEWGNPVAGVGVTFTAFPVGSVTGSPATTDANGVATVGNWTLGTTTGLFRERLQTVTATAGQLSTTFTGRAVAGPPVSVTVRPRGGSTPFEAPPKESLNVGEEQTFEAIVYDAYGNTVYGQTVNFSSSNPEAVDLSAPRLQIGLGGTGPATYVDVRALLVAVDQTVEIRASVAGMPNVQGVSSIVVNKTLLPVAKSDDIQLAPCPAFGCLSVPVTFTTNVFLDHGFGPDDRGSPVAVITRFDVTPPGGSPAPAAGSTIEIGAPLGGISLVSAQLSADGTLTITRRDQSLLDGGFTAVLFYELKNIGGSSIGAVTISRGSNGSDCTVSSLGCAVGGMSTSASASTSISTPSLVRSKQTKTP